MSDKLRIWRSSLIALWVLLVLPATANAAGNNVGANVANLLKGYATELYSGVVGIVSLIFLVNRRFNELVVFLFVAIVVAWMVFAPSELAKAGEALAKQILG
jgi:hypothetical protein